MTAPPSARRDLGKKRTVNQITKDEKETAKTPAKTPAKRTKDQNGDMVEKEATPTSAKAGKRGTRSAAKAKDDGGEEELKGDDTEEVRSVRKSTRAKSATPAPKVDKKKQKSKS